MRNRILLTLLIALVTFGALSTQAEPAHAQFRIGPHGGMALEGETLFLGADAWFGLYRINELISIHANPGLSYYLLEGDASRFTVDLDAQFLLEVSDSIAPYAGPGLSIARANAGDSEATDVDVTVTGGALFLHTDQIQPFAEIRVRGLTETPAFEIAAGALFRF